MWSLKHLQAIGMELPGLCCLWRYDESINDFFALWWNSNSQVNTEGRIKKLKTTPYGQIMAPEASYMWEAYRLGSPSLHNMTYPPTGVNLKTMSLCTKYVPDHETETMFTMAAIKPLDEDSSLFENFLVAAS